MAAVVTETMYGGKEPEQDQDQDQDQDRLPEDKTTSSIYVHHFPAGGSTNNVVEALRVLERSVFKKHESLVLVLVLVLIVL
jgi:hypothetical protein